MRRRSVRPAFVLAALLPALSCAGEPAAEGGWQGTVETVDGVTTVHNPPAGVWAEGQGGHIVEELRIGSMEGDGPDVFGSVLAIAVSSRGDIAVLDGQAMEVRVFDRAGEYLRTVGRRGAGPGELQSPLAVHYDGADRLWVVDLANARYEVFGPDGEFLRSSPRRARGVVLSDPGVLGSVGLLDPIPVFTPDGEIQRLWVVVDTAGTTTDTLPPLSMGSMSRLAGVPASLAPFLPLVTATAGPDGDVWFASTDRYEIVRRTPAGDTAFVTALDGPRRHLSTEDRDSIDAAIRAWPHPVDRSALGLGVQYIRSLHADDRGWLFVEPRLEDADAGRRFDVFDDRGRYLGRIESDVSFASRPPVLFRRGAVYGVVTDELDVPYVVRARVEAPGLPERDP